MTSFNESDAWTEDQYGDYFGSEHEPDDERFELLALDEGDPRPWTSTGTGARCHRNVQTCWQQRCQIAAIDVDKEVL